jgi:AraC-like DNA-binding protein
MHRTFTQYVNDLRTDEACRLLTCGQSSVTSIAFLAGFENLSYFNRVFRRSKGMSPSAYRDAWARGAAAERHDDLRSA